MYPQPRQEVAEPWQYFPVEPSEQGQNPRQGKARVDKSRYMPGSEEFGHLPVRGRQFAFRHTREDPRAQDLPRPTALIFPHLCQGGVVKIWFRTVRQCVARISRQQLRGAEAPCGVDERVRVGSRWVRGKVLSVLLASKQPTRLFEHFQLGGRPFTLNIKMIIGDIRAPTCAEV